MKLTNRNIMLCEMSSDLFRLSCQRNYDSEDFINKLMTSEEGQLLYSDNCTDMWLGAEHIMQGLENEIEIKKGKVINANIMAWMGYVYKCWSLTYPNETATDIIKQAPVSTLAESYMGLHVMSCEDAILNLKEIYAEQY